jgi:hypothetical protein
MRDDDKRRRHKRDRANRRARFEARKRDDHPTDDEFKRLYQMGIAAGRTPVLTDDADGREFLLDLSPGVVEGVPWSEVRDLFGDVLGPRRHANTTKKSPNRHRLPVGHCHMETESAVLVPHQDPDVSPACVVTLMWCPDCPNAWLVACTLAELHDPADPVWRPDLRDFLKAEAADLQARAEGGEGVLSAPHEEVEMVSHDRCPACGTRPGQLHHDGCDVECCSGCGGQRFSCGCGDDEGLARLPWTGEWPGVAECREFGWYARLVPGHGWEQCGPDEPGARPDLNRLILKATWDRERGRFVR